jgi:hypothetical protein
MASQKTNTVMKDYTAAPLYFSENSNGAHVWLIEFEKEPENFESFISELDAVLKNISSGYEARRHKGIAKRTPVVHTVQKATKKSIVFFFLLRIVHLSGQYNFP